jgi:hypothetical protein
MNVITVPVPIRYLAKPQRGKNTNNTYKNKRITATRIRSRSPAIAIRNNQRNTRRNSKALNTSANLVSIRRIPNVQSSEAHFVKMQSPLHTNKLNLTRRSNNYKSVRSLKRQLGFRNIFSKNDN